MAQEGRPLLALARLTESPPGTLRLGQDCHRLVKRRYVGSSWRPGTRPWAPWQSADIGQELITTAFDAESRTFGINGRLIRMQALRAANDTSLLRTGLRRS